MLDEQALERLRQLDPGGLNRLLPRVLSTYSSSIVKLTDQLRAGQAAGDLAAVQMAVHTLKSSSASVGALDLASLCGQAEHAVREQRHQDLPSLLAQLLTEAGRVDAAVQHLLTQTK